MGDAVLKKDTPNDALRETALMQYMRGQASIGPVKDEEGKVIETQVYKFPAERDTGKWLINIFDQRMGDEKRDFFLDIWGNYRREYWSNGTPDNFYQKNGLIIMQKIEGVLKEGRDGGREYYYRPLTDIERADVEKQKAVAAKQKAEEEAEKAAKYLAVVSPEPPQYASVLEESADGRKVAKYVVTQYLFEKLMGYNPSENKYALYPVKNISFYEIMVFCNRLSLAAGLKPVYIIKKSGNPDDWGDTPTQKDKKWQKYKIDSKADGYCLITEPYNPENTSEYGVESYDERENYKDTDWYFNTEKKYPCFKRENTDLWVKYPYGFRVEQNKVMTAKEKLKAFWDSL